MTIRPSLALSITSVLILAACASPGKIERAKNVPADGASFNSSLARGYSDITRFESDRMYDWPDADHFADKTLMAAEGRTVPPEDPKDWSIRDEAARRDLEQARAALLAAYADGFREENQAAAASAQTNYDCWVEESEEGWQTEYITRCREGFMNAMQQRQPAPVATPTPQRALVFFDWNDASLAPEATDLLDAIADRINASSDAVVSITGHADRSGPAAYNLRLSERRAMNVRDALEIRGVPETRMTVDWRGEEAPRVPTDDGVREPENRRVELEATGGGGSMAVSSLN